MIDETAERLNVPADLLASVVDASASAEEIERAAARLRECLLSANMEHVAALALYHATAGRAPVVKRVASWLYWLTNNGR